MKVRAEGFGKSHLYTFVNASGASCSITDRAGAIVSIRVPDRHGNLDEVILGFRNEKQYINNKGYLGSLIGPVGNRIGSASFDFNGAHYAFEPNENGRTLLHSGAFGFHSCVWDSVAEATETEGRLVLKHLFPNAETGFPGNLDVTVTYTFTEDNRLSIHYHIESDAPSFASPTNHTYFNIGGLGGKHIPSVDRQVMQIFADEYTAVDEYCIPTGVESVEGTPFDLREGKKLKDGFACESENAQMTIGGGYDHNFVLNGETDENGLRHAAKVTDSYTGRTMDVYTDLTGVQFYSANHLQRYDDSSKRFYTKRHALCLETQCAPDSIHHDGEHGYCVAKIDKDQPFDSVTVYAFGIKK